MLAPPKPAPPGIDWVATLAVVGGMAAAVGALVVLVVGVIALVRWIDRSERAGRARREAERLAHEEAMRRAQDDARRARWEDLTRRFGGENAARIIGGEIWQGQTSEMLIEAIGRPVDMDEKVMKTRTRHVLKWGHQGANRFALRVTLDDGIVVGWER